jgi:hypothetical protein
MVDITNSDKLSDLKQQKVYTLPIVEDRSVKSRYVQSWSLVEALRSPDLSPGFLSPSVPFS